MKRQNRQERMTGNSPLPNDKQIGVVNIDQVLQWQTEVQWQPRRPTGSEGMTTGHQGSPAQTNRVTSVERMDTFSEIVLEKVIT
jgi:hypothetical protein